MIMGSYVNLYVLTSYIPTLVFSEWKYLGCTTPPKDFINGLQFTPSKFNTQYCMVDFFLFRGLNISITSSI